MSRRIVRTVSLLLICLIGFASAAGAVLRIDRFDATIHVADNGSLDVAERLSVTFSTPHHGIERFIPVRYRNGINGVSTTIDLDIVEIRMDDSSVPFESRLSGSNRYVRIGDPDRTLLGTHVYTIEYRVRRALLFHDTSVQLYWNVTGNQWSIPIDSATATVHLPDSVSLDDVATTSYVSIYGGTSRGNPARAEDGAFAFETGLLSPGEGLTIDLSIPRDALPFGEPSLATRALWFASANWPIVLPLLAFAGMMILWFRTGRDPRKRTIAPAYEPPRGTHSGQVGVLIDDRIDLRDITAMVIELAVDGHLRIEEVRSEDDEERSRTRKRPSIPDDHKLVRTPGSAKSLSSVQELLLETIFDKDHREERTLSSLENKFYKTLPTIKSRLYSELIDKRYYTHNPERIRRSYTSLGIVGMIAGAALGFWTQSLVLGAGIAACGLIVLLFAPIMPRKTQSGVRALEEILGLSEYIGRAEVERIEFHDAPEKDPALFSKLLPYAIALNLTKVWTDQFEGLLEEPPTWYASSSTVFRAHWFGLSMTRLTSGMERTFVSAPRASSSGRSAWGGHSSFGGGFSGGGFGGGGGGGW